MKPNTFIVAMLMGVAITLTPIAPAPATSSSGNQVTVESPSLLAQRSQTRRIRFARGTTGTVVEDAVVLGTRNIYLLRARRGQTMTLNLSSIEENGVFDIQAPNGQYLSQESTSWRGVLPQSGDYSVIVGSTRGNATYTLDVTIR